jgi:PAS domain S-box-containing protein
MSSIAARHLPNDRSSDDLLRQLVDGIKDYAIYVLSPEGNVLTWNSGAEALMGYSKEEILGTHFSKFFLPEATRTDRPTQGLAVAEKEGRWTDEGWRVRKDGSRFWACVVITPLRDSTGELCGFAKVTQDITERREAAERIGKLSAQVLHVQDEERRRIARELHDDLGQQLLAIKMFVDKSKDEKAIELADSAVTWVRNLAYLLHPPLLDEMGLSSALSWFVNGMTERSGIKVELDIQPNNFPRLGTDIETAIFRIVQESLTNVFRHSSSDRATVELEKHDKWVIVRIRDYGRGFPSGGESIEKKAVGVGIAGMSERIRQLGGSLTVVRQEPGTLVEANVPLSVSAE